MVSVNCPSCGSKVTFRTDFSTHAVCGACESLLVRHGAQVEQIGKVAELQPDGSPLRVGTQQGQWEQGRYRWQLQVQPWQEAQGQPAPGSNTLLHIQLQVRWGERASEQLELQSLRLATAGGEQ